uniref:Uncharacterized protein n=1 Tax=Setaria viridis TaxID=4556 RepID=A0A4U6TGU6_SETVI|nr:hypothetical protein SEVIR_8G187066v2 [Setaria viridis]
MCKHLLSSSSFSLNLLLLLLLLLLLRYCLLSPPPSAHPLPVARSGGGATTEGAGEEGVEGAAEEGTERWRRGRRRRREAKAGGEGRQGWGELAGDFLFFLIFQHPLIQVISTRTRGSPSSTRLLASVAQPVLEVGWEPVLSPFFL